MSYFLVPPTFEKVKKLLEKQCSSSFSYPNPGIAWAEGAASQLSSFKKYDVDSHRAFLGQGESAFKKAKECFENWGMFSLEWIRLYPERPVMQEGVTLGILVRVCGVWVLNFCRVVRVVVEERSIGFSYGTLPSHAEQGEEKFAITWSKEDNAVCYEIKAFSKPRLFISKLAYPYVRALQRRFCRQSMNKMRELTVEGQGFGK